jgi:hypothetical protein
MAEKLPLKTRAEIEAQQALGLSVKKSAELLSLSWNSVKKYRSLSLSDDPSLTNDQRRIYDDHVKLCKKSFLQNLQINSYRISEKIAESVDLPIESWQDVKSASIAMGIHAQRSNEAEGIGASNNTAINLFLNTSGSDARPPIDISPTEAINLARDRLVRQDDSVIRAQANNPDQQIPHSDPPLPSEPAGRDGRKPDPKTDTSPAV